MTQDLARDLALVLALASAMVVWAPAVALAAPGKPIVPPVPGSTSPFAPGVPQAPVTVPTQTTPAATAPSNGTSTSGGSGISGSGAVAIAIGAIVVLGGISFFIWRDARRHAPVRHRAGAAADGTVSGGSRGSKAPPKPRKLSPAERRRRKRGRAQSRR